MSRATRPHRRTLPSILLALVAVALGACTSTTGSPPASASAAPSGGAAAAPTAAPAVTPTPAPAPAFPLTLTDDEGGSVSLAAEPGRIVSLTPAVTETLFALGVGARIVGNDDYDDFPPEAKEIEPVASYTGVDVEKLVSLSPDLVIAGGGGFTDPDAVAKIRSLGIPVLVVYANDVDETLADIELIGRAVGRSDAAVAMTREMRTAIAAISAATRELDSPRVFYELDATREIFGPADDSFLVELIVLAGGTPITTGSSTVFSIPIERLVEADPEVIVLGDANYGTTVEQVLARPGWATMTAVKEGTIRPIDDTVVTRPGPRLVEGLRALALAIHPDATLPPAPSFPPLGPAGSGG